MQCVDGRNIVLLNRDDASGFRLDTLSTHCLHASPTVKGKEILTTYTDYVNKYPSTLQTSSYNFTSTSTTPELCAGIVKASVLFPKNAAQHASDIKMLEQMPHFKAAFYHPESGVCKAIECIRVDGAADEGPMHEEVQFFWSARHLEKGYYATYVTARCSGQSYLNRVELQNGCLGLGHSNLYIPSTLTGTNMDSSKVNYERIRKNLDLAIDVYIDRVDNSPCGDGTIKLVKGADSPSNQELRKYVIQFLKGSKAQKNRLQVDHTYVYDYINRVWKVRQDHMLPDLPTPYCFVLVCCMKTDCLHPICSSGNNPGHCWYEGGPPVKFVPLPVPDLSRPWGSECESCKEKGLASCHGHFLSPADAAVSKLPPMSKPPSFKNVKGKASPEVMQMLAKTCYCL